MLNIYGPISVPEEMIDTCRKMYPHMNEDVSSYAKGRKRVWLGREWSLNERKFFSAPDSETANKILSWSQDVIKEFSDWQPEIGLLTWSGKSGIGINPHRDDSYADYESWGINLIGECEFEYRLGYKGFTWTKEKETGIKSVNLIPGSVWQFNCKNLHSAKPSPKRLGLNLWRISSKFRMMYEMEN